jgi:hypothetical protein
MQGWLDLHFSLDSSLRKRYDPHKLNEEKIMVSLTNHTKSNQSLRSYPGAICLDNFMLSCADLPGSREQILPKRGEPMK